MTTRQPIYKSLYFQVIVAIVIGILLGHFYPQTGVALKPLGDGFIKLIKMVIAPIIFCTVVSGIAGMQSMKSVGKTGGYALLYFEIVSTIALLIGLGSSTLAQAPAAPSYHLIPGAMPPDKGPDGNSIFLDAPEGLILIDTGRHPEHSARNSVNSGPYQ